MKSVRRGFTLIELLVVVAIIALLISILLPSLKGARDQAKRAVCMSNLHSMSHALHGYVTEHKHYPGDHAISGRNSMVAWAPRLCKYYLVDKREVFNCPFNGPESRWEQPFNWVQSSQQILNDARQFGYYGPRMTGEDNERPLFWEQNELFFSYAYNGYGVKMGFGTEPHFGLGGHVNTGRNPEEANHWELPERKVRKPDDMIVIADSNTDGKEDTWLTCEAGFPNAWPGRKANDSANVLWADYHVSRKKTDDLLRLDEVERRRWNNDHEPHREFWDPAGMP